jgi:hypothetical protein
MLRPVFVGIVVLSSLGALAESASFWETLPSKAKAFVCGPATISIGSKIRIRVSSPHGTDFGVRTPDNNFYFIYSCDTEARSDEWRAVDCEAFAQLKTITIDPRKLKSSPTPRQAGSKSVLVFAKPGTYTFMLAKNLETENTDETVNKCQVTFKPSGNAP